MPNPALHYVHIPSLGDAESCIAIGTEHAPAWESSLQLANIAGFEAIILKTYANAEKRILGGDLEALTQGVFIYVAIQGQTDKPVSEACMVAREYVRIGQAKALQARSSIVPLV